MDVSRIKKKKTMKVISSWQHRQKLGTPNKKNLNRLIVRIAELANLDLKETETISVNLVGPRVMRRINREFLNHDYLTDVICFNYRSDIDYDEEDIAVEIFISPDIAIERGQNDSKIKYSSEVILYIVHAILHATGLKDKTDAEKKIMRQEESRILQELSEWSDLFQVKKTE